MNYNIYTLGFLSAYGKDIEDFLSYEYKMEHFEDINELYSEIKDLNNKVIIFIAIPGDFRGHTNTMFGFNINKFSNIEVVFVQSEISSVQQLYYHNNNIQHLITNGFDAFLIDNMIEMLLKQSPVTIQDDNFNIDLLNRTIIYNDTIVETTNKIYEAIVYFVKNPGRVISTQEILAEILNLEFSLNNDPAVKLIERTRTATSKHLFKNVRGQGYVYGEKVTIPNPTIIDSNQDLMYFPGSGDETIWKLKTD